MNFILVGLGGALGAMSRYLIYLLIAPLNTLFPWPTFIVNSLGCLIAGGVLGKFPDILSTNQSLYIFLGVGFLGSFTTFSAMALDLYLLHSKGKIELSLIHLFANFIIATSMFYIGHKAAIAFANSN